jgi:hypothetical protein
MLQEVAALGALALESIKSLRLTRRNRNIIAKAVCTIYRELDALVENGDKILRMLKRHNNGHGINLRSLGHLIQEQQVIIARLNTKLKQSKVKTALSIHAPQLSPLQVLLEGKSARLAILREDVNRVRRHIEVAPPDWIRRFGRIKLPSNSAIEKSRRELKKIKAQTEELRKFIVSNFQVHEVV